MGSPKSEKLVGQVFANRYRIIGALGSGTMGTVYRAEHVHMKKAVAVKVLHASHVKDSEVVERFQREAQAAANIDHPNICAATDFGKQDDQTYYLVMEYLDGRSLHDAIKDGENFSQLRAIHLMKQVCSGLMRAHELGVVHRDLKPENILLVEREGDRDFVKITDFGVAQVRLFKDAARLTQAGVVYGSPLYMSPEQAGGKEVDHRADLYSVGIMLYELLTGKLPFYAKSLTVVLNMHLQDPPPPFREANPYQQIDPELEEIVMRLLAKRRDERFQTAEALLDALTDVEERLKNPRRKRGKSDGEGGGLFKALLVSLTIILAGILVVVGAWSLVDLDGPQGPDANSDETAIQEAEGEALAAKRAEYAKNPDVERALTKMNESPEDGIKSLSAVAARDSQNPHAHFLLGHAHVDQGEWAKGFAAYEKAIELEPNYARDRELLDDVMRRFESSRDDESEQAEVFIKKRLKNAATARLAALAEFHKVRKIRKRAFELLRESGEFAKLDQWNQYTIELRHAVGCETNRDWVIKIGELSDPRGLAALQRFSAKPKDRCDGQDCWGCLREDLRKSIATLKARQNVPAMQSD